MLTDNIDSCVVVWRLRPWIAEAHGLRTSLGKVSKRAYAFAKTDMLAPLYPLYYILASERVSTKLLLQESPSDLPQLADAAGEYAYFPDGPSFCGPHGRLHWRPNIDPPLFADGIVYDGFTRTGLFSTSALAIVRVLGGDEDDR